MCTNWYIGKNVDYFSPCFLKFWLIILALGICREQCKEKEGDMVFVTEE